MTRNIKDPGLSMTIDKAKAAARGLVHDMRFVSESDSPIDVAEISMREARAIESYLDDIHAEMRELYQYTLELAQERDDEGEVL